MEYKYGLVLPERLVSQYFGALMKRRGKQMPQFITTRFDGDEVDTKLWVEEKEGEWILLSQFEGRDYVQEVMTPEEMFSKQDMKPASLRGKILQMFRELGCSTDEAFENTMNFMASHSLSDDIQRASPGTKKFLALFQLLKNENIQPYILSITPEGNVIIHVKEEHQNKMREFNERLGLDSSSGEETTEDPK